MTKYLLVASRKGLIVYSESNSGWKHHQTHFLGFPVSYVYADEETNYWWAFLDHGHWGVKIHRSKDKGGTWEEITSPEYPEGEEVKDGVKASLKYIWAFANSGNGSGLWMGTDPGGLFFSNNGGNTFELNKPLWNHPTRKEKWFGGGRDNPGIHSIAVDPRDSNHIYIGISCAGVFETLDAGQTWNVRNKGLKADFLPDPEAEVGQDPHLLVLSPSDPDVLWQQNHCGIFRSSNAGANWENVSEDKGLANFGFTIGVHDKDPNMAWVIPAVSDQTRVAVDGSLCVCRTDDGGKTWETFRNGLPQENCFDIVYRHSLAVNENQLVFGSTTGNLFVSNDLGESWDTISNFLPMIYCIKITKA